MKKVLIIMTIGILILISGCSAGAVSAEPSSDAAASGQETLAPDNMHGDLSNAPARTSDFRGENNQNETLGKITAISGNTITLAVGTIKRPEGIQREGAAPSAGDKSRPEGQSRPQRADGGSRPENAPEMPARQADGSMPGGERPADANKRGPGGFFGGAMELEYSGEEISYTLSDSVTITKGMGENSEKLAVSDLTQGNIVRLLMDEAKQPVSVQVFEISE